MAAGDAGLEVGGLALGWPELSLWRPPTDNDDPPGRWRRRAPVQRWRAAGLDRLEVDDRDLTRRGGRLLRTTRLAAGEGHHILHRQKITIEDGHIRVDERVDIDPGIEDLPRVGVCFAVPPEGGTRLDWFGLGPGDSYPDRRAAPEVGRWRVEVAGQGLPFVVPQEFGLHLDTRWFSLSGAQAGLTVSADRHFAFSALSYTAADLTDATHAHQLVARAETSVHLDVAHRGLGTAACGPDTHRRFRIGPGTYRWTWQLAPAPPIRPGRRGQPDAVAAAAPIRPSRYSGRRAKPS